jgi:hypothetical protein
MLQHRPDNIQIEVAGDHHQWLVNVREPSGARRTFTFHSYSEVISVVLEELVGHWQKEGRLER